MVNFKNIRIKMKGGKTRTQRVKVLASGKYKFVKNIKRMGKAISKKSSPKKSKSKSASRKGGNRMGKGRNIQATAFKWIRIGALVGGGAMEAMKYDSLPDKAIAGVLSYAGINYSFPRFEWDLLIRTWTPYLAAVATTIGIPKIAAIIRRL